MEVRLDPRRPIVLLDWSYFVFWRFFATYGWFARAAAEATGTDGLHENPSFVAAFKKQSYDALQKFRTKYGAPQGNLVALLDAPRPTLWRTAVLPTYKANRDAKRPPQGTGMNPAFFAISEAWLAEQGIAAVRVEGLEADDLASLFAARIAPVAPDLVLVSNDNDWGQLGAPGVRVRSVDDQDIAARSGNLEAKIFCGDPGDNIPPVCARCGPKTAEKLAANADAAAAYMAKHPEAEAGLARNRLLIDLTRIPKAQQERFQAAVTIVF